MIRGAWRNRRPFFEIQPMSKVHVPFKPSVDFLSPLLKGSFQCCQDATLRGSSQARYRFRAQAKLFQHVLSYEVVLEIFRLWTVRAIGPFLPISGRKVIASPIVS